MGPEKLLTTSKVAALLGISRGALAVRRHRGQGPPHLRLGSSIRYRPADVRDWIDGLPREVPALRRTAGERG